MESVLAHLCQDKSCRVFVVAFLVFLWIWLLMDLASDEFLGFWMGWAEVIFPPWIAKARATRTLKDPVVGRNLLTSFAQVVDSWYRGGPNFPIACFLKPWSPCAEVTPSGVSPAEIQLSFQSASNQLRWGLPQAMELLEELECNGLGAGAASKRLAMGDVVRPSAAYSRPSPALQALSPKHMEDEGL